jgi:hypothetical protein
MRILFVADRRLERDRSFAIFNTLRTFSSGIASFSAGSSGVGSRPMSCSIWRDVRTILLIVPIMCTGTSVPPVVACMKEHREQVSAGCKLAVLQHIAEKRGSGSADSSP